MRLEELVNKYYDKLNENDKMIWQYIQANKKKCCDISIEELAEICCISRTTISRFTQKLSFDGFREFKLHLKLECENESRQDQLLLEDVCSNFARGIQMAKDKNMDEICERIFCAKRLFVFGTGESQYAAAQLMKRIFMSVNRFFVPLYGRSELTMALEDMKTNDVAVLISLSGETEPVVSAAKKMRIKGVYTISITRLSDNTLSRLCQTSLYIQPNPFVRKGSVSFETCSSYFNVIEILCIKYMLYLKVKSETDVQPSVKDAGAVPVREWECRNGLI